jgi:murein L,D-transpeptidase YcbB/YkuD
VTCHASRAFACLAAAVAVAGSGPPPDRAAATRGQVESGTRSEASTAIEALVTGRTTTPRLSPAARRDLAAFYGPRQYAAAWTDGSGQPTPDALKALAIIAGAATHGLDPDDYGSSTLHRLSTLLNGATGQTPSDRALFDVVLSRGILRFWRELHIGRIDPREVGFRLSGQKDDHDFPARLRAALDAHEVGASTEAFAPPLVLYRGLRAALARYRTLSAGPAFESLTLPSAAVKPGQRSAFLHALQRRLTAFGDMPDSGLDPGQADTYEGAFVEGVRRFQERHGLETDGVIGRATAAALAAPPSARVRQIELALERLRWLPHVGDDRFLAVNIPMFHLWAFEARPAGGVPAFGMKVIVGRALDTETPAIIESLRYVIFRPYWNVPLSILRGEVLPKLLQDPEYLRRQNMEIVDGPGDAARRVEATPETLARLRAGSLRVRQRPGPANALGLVKFVFPNDENIFMHGTPELALFGRPRRDFSHGCVRVADPVTLAAWALEDQREWTRDRILAAMHGPGPRRVDLSRPMPVILYYLTAIVMPDSGDVHFAEDVYGHDRRLGRALERRARTDDRSIEDE